MEKVKKTLRDSAAARWTALVIVSFTMLCGYFLSDVMAPLKPMLEEVFGWNSAEYGIFTSAYGWLNVFLFMLIIGGIILDKMGGRFTGMMSCILMVIGVALKYYAVSHVFPEGATIAGIRMQVAVAAGGFAIFGVGIETAGITVTKLIVKWFKGKEMALAMGLQVAVARIGTGLAMMITLPIARAWGISTPLLVGLVLLCVGTISFMVYCVMDKKLDKSIAEANEESGEAPEEPFKISDIGMVIKNKGFWLIALLCVLFYSGVFPFLKYATDFMINKYGVDPKFAGIIPGLLPFGTILLTPLFGGIYDQKGKGATIMLIGAFMLVGIHALFAVPAIDSWIFAVLLMILLGVAFSLVPSAMWPSVPKIIPEKQLGTAYSLIFWVQNWGLMGVPALIGWVLEKYCKTVTVSPAGESVIHYDYTLPMVIFACFGVLAVVVALALKREDSKKGYGLQLPNVQK